MLVTAIFLGVIVVLLVTLFITGIRYSNNEKSLKVMIEQLSKQEQKNAYCLSKTDEALKHSEEFYKGLLADSQKCFEEMQKLADDYLNELNKYKFPNSYTLKYMQKISMEGSYCYFNYIDAGYVYLTNPEYCKQFGQAGKKVNIIQFEEGLKACTIVLLKD